MSDFEHVIAQAVADRVVPGVVLLAENTSGSFCYKKTLGLCSVEPGREKDLQPDSVFMWMSMTKLVTAVVAVQAVERGLIELDADVAPLLPELAALPVLAGFAEDTGVPELVPRTAPITLRHLLTHSSGVGYDFLTPDLLRYHAWIRNNPDAAAAMGIDPAPPAMDMFPTSVETRFRYPLVFQPGQGWQYGANLDWTGRLLERVHGNGNGNGNHGTTLEDLVIRDVLAPLGLPAGAFTFHPERYPAVLARMWPSLPRRAGNSSGALDAGPVVHGPSLYTGGPVPAALGGQGLFGDMPSFFRVVRSLLRDDGKLLSPASTELLFTPHLASDAARAGLLRDTASGRSGWITGDVPDTREYDWSLAGLLVTGSSHPVRHKGALLWAGAINLTWIIDKEAGIAAVFASNYQPPGDLQGKALMRQWEAFVYAQAKAKL